MSCKGNCKSPSPLYLKIIFRMQPTISSILLNQAKGPPFRGQPNVRFQATAHPPQMATLGAKRNVCFRLIQALKHEPDLMQLFLEPVRGAIVLCSGRSQGSGL
jgi:hypothetical protein